MASKFGRQTFSFPKVLRNLCALGVLLNGVAGYALESNSRTAEFRLNRAREIETHLDQMNRDPRAFLDKTPPKFDARTGLPLGPLPRRKPEVGSPEFGKFRKLFQETNRVHALSSSERSRNNPFRLAQSFAGSDVRGQLSTLQQIESAKLLEAEISESPWSSSYWPLYKGALAQRYADVGFDGVHPEEYSAYYDYTHKPGRRFPEFLHGLMDSAPEMLTLSPAEKYDLIVGDDEGHLSENNWQQGASYADNGHVEEWMGLCHGWAPASYREDRPIRSIQVLAADGHTKVTFFPTDIKGLSSLLWAKAQVPTRFIGSRCNERNPKRDEHGRIVSEECFDTDPGIWHLSIVNRLGRGGKSFVFDNTYDYEVWNQPVQSYHYTYFNPRTRKNADSIEQAKVSVESFPEDIFAKYRAPRKEGLTHIVGVAMDVVYVSETYPTQESTDSVDDDRLVSVRYMYDLELNAKGEILGGEWYSNAHPDFLWTPEDDQRAETFWDEQVSADWGLGTAMPEEWRVAAKEGASSSGLPLAKIVRQLIKWARD